MRRWIQLLWISHLYCTEITLRTARYFFHDNLHLGCMFLPGWEREPEGPQTRTLRQTCGGGVQAPALEEPPVGWEQHPWWLDPGREGLDWGWTQFVKRKQPVVWWVRLLVSNTEPMSAGCSLLVVPQFCLSAVAQSGVLLLRSAEAGSWWRMEAWVASGVASGTSCLSVGCAGIGGVTPRQAARLTLASVTVSSRLPGCWHCTWSGVAAGNPSRSCTTTRLSMQISTSVFLGCSHVEAVNSCSVGLRWEEWNSPVQRWRWSRSYCSHLECEPLQEGGMLLCLDLQLSSIFLST